jgi:hypothetical protein
MELYVVWAIPFPPNSKVKQKLRDKIRLKFIHEN